MSPKEDAEHMESVTRYDELKEDIETVDFHLSMCKDYRAKAALDNLRDVLMRAKKIEQNRGV